MKTCVGKKQMRIRQLSLLAGAFLLWSGLLMPAMLGAAPAISAGYVQARGTQLAIEITTGSNPPASAILVQQLPPGVRILASQPGFSNYDARRNQAKWLLRQLSPGKSTVTMTLDRAVSANEISAEIRFKPQQGGKMTTIQVKK
ncbi:MAG TPA: hypothetical protein ENO25_01690 [Desulfobacteraceae bacterium]|nr:hypothetical protein [Desulfobacteraceae bacterium]